uniref:Circumsporozoite protein-like n=1 Tax=Oryza sativa subsp. japonica TaxID=39947 RepID=Q6Z9S5_ORYSJ|nr:circumsporozoite protein-like [Oryza sativa Japonica Group]BAD09853.1 circumsporozoite protein-like [Oryza sativa Japonica Group]
MRRAHAQPHGSRWNVRTGGADRGRPDPISAELAPTWRLRGATRAGRRTRGDEPTARIRRRELDGGELRRRQLAGREEGKGDEVTRGQFPAVRASTRLRESVASVGLGGATPSEAGDERVLRSTGGDGGEHTASGGNGRGGAG